MKIPLWLYWEDPVNTPRPAYIDMCIETVHLHCSTDFDIHVVTPDTLSDYIDVPKELYRFTEVAHKADYIRYLLLYKYGGMWLDCDMIVLRPLTDIINKLNEYSFISRGNNHISINFLLSIKNNPIFKQCITTIQDKISRIPAEKKITFNWSEIGSDLITPIVKKYDNNYIYGDYQFAPIRWNESILFIYPEVGTPDISTCYTVAISNKVQQRNNCKITSMSKRDILESNTVIGKIFRTAYGNK